MPCEDLPNRKVWAWSATTREAPPVVAIAAAVMAGLAALLLGQAAGEALISALVVGVGTFGVLYLWHWVRAPTQIRAERERRLTEWRDRYSGSVVPTKPPNQSSLTIALEAATGEDLRDCWCVVERDGVRTEARQGSHGLSFGPSSSAHSVHWDYPTSFGPSAVLGPGRYKMTHLMGEHVEPIHEAEWEIDANGVMRPL